MMNDQFQSFTTIMIDMSLIYPNMVDPIYR